MDSAMKLAPRVKDKGIVMRYSGVKNFEVDCKLNLLGIELDLALQCDVSLDPSAGFFCEANFPNAIRFCKDYVVIHDAHNDNKGPYFKCECRPMKGLDGFMLEFSGGVYFFGLKAK